jgi:hypothetical protein
MAGHLPGIWQDAGIASSGCEAVATINSKITSAFFTRVKHILAPNIPGGELIDRHTLHTQAINLSCPEGAPRRW